MEKKKIFALVLATLAAAVFSSFITAAILTRNFLRQESSGYPAAVQESKIVDVAREASPAVVAITISKYVPVYERYFEQLPFGFVVTRIREQGVEKVDVGGGSGFLVSPDGYIVTNKHVVSDEQAEYTVFLNDGSKYSAQVVARDEELDLAVMKISGSSFPFLVFGDSDNLQVGEGVIAIGNALAEFRNTVSAGIVSGLSRSVVARDRLGRTEELNHLIQTDAAINPGNSGGPLLNLKGEVIGVNVAQAEGAENIGFAIGGNSAKRMLEKLRGR